jgi:signal transduction histidine kinase
MNTLRAKIATLIVAAIVVVIGLVGASMIVVIPIPAFERLVDINAYYVSVIHKSVGSDSFRDAAEAMSAGEAGRFGIKPEPASGDLLEEMTQQLRSALQRRKIFTPVAVTQSSETFWPAASIAIPGRGWLVIPVFIPPMPPAEVLPLLFGWIVVGTAVVAIVLAYRLMQPLALIEKSLAKINPSGELPMLVETGPADIRATARAINLLSSRLNSATESRMRLIAAAGHDFRMPMTRMRLRAEFLDEPYREKFLADIEELDHIADSAIRLVHEEMPDRNGDAVRLDVLISDVIVELQELQLNVSAVGTEAVQVKAKPLSLKRAIRNLLINAATHGGGATVIVRRESRSALIEIADHGPGIPEAFLTRAFEPFFRLERARSMAGTGLGLAIANEIIQRNRGHLTLTNRPGGGLLQTIELPAASIGSEL